MFGYGCQLHEGFVGQIRHGNETRNCRDIWTTARIDEKLFAFEQIVSDFELMRVDKTGVAAIETKVGAFVDLFLLTTAKTQNDFIFLGDNFGEIDADVW